MQLIYLLGWIRKKKWIKGGHQCHLEWQCDLWQCTTNETQWYTKRCPLTFYINWEKNIGIFNENDCNTLQDLFMVNNCVYLIYRHHSMTSFRCFLNQHHLSHWKCLWWKLTICKWWYSCTQWLHLHSATRNTERKFYPLVACLTAVFLILTRFHVHVSQLLM